MKAVVYGAVLCALTVAQLRAASAPVGSEAAVLGRATELRTRLVDAGGSTALELPPLHDFSFSTAPDGTRYLLMSARLGAPAVRVRFTNFRVPLDAAVFIYGVTETGIVTDTQGPFTGAGPAGTHEFWSQPVRGDAVIEFQPGSRVFATLPFVPSEVTPADPPADGAETAAASDAGELRTVSFRDRNVVCEIRNGIGMLEGDIELGPAALLEPARSESKYTRREGVALTETRYRWPGGLLPYVMDPAITYRQVILDAIAHWNTNLAGVIRIVPRTTEANYVQFRDNRTPQCSSAVGMIGWGAQTINLSSACGFGAVVHEIGHALGLFHEQSREDRDSRITVLYDNIQPAMAYNFAQAVSNAEDLGAYDYNSIMHYGPYAFSANGQPTIETVPAGIPIGQRAGLSAGDIAAVRAMYASVLPMPPSAPEVEVTVGSNPSGLQIAVDATPLRSPYTLHRPAGSQFAIAAPSPQFVSGTRYDFARWSDSGAQSHAITTPISPATFTANYIRSFRLSVSSSAGGSVALTPASTSGYYAENSTVTISAAAAAGYCFAGWSGLISGTPSTTPVLVTTEYSVAAHFTPGGNHVTRMADWFPAAGGEIDIPVTAGTGCAWEVVPHAPWIHVAGATTGSGTGISRISVDANYTRMLRMGIVQIGTATYLVVQSGF